MVNISLRVRPTIVLFGDSITQFGFGNSPETQYGWASLLAAAYTRRCDILNRGFSGYNSRHAVELLPRIFTDDTAVDTLFCTVFFGANDAAVPGEAQHIAIEEYTENIQKIVTSIRSKAASPSLPILLITPPPVDEEAWAKARGTSPVSDRTNARAKAYGNAAREKLHGHVSVVDAFHLLEGDSSNRAQYLSDGLHLNEKGNTRLFEGLMAVLRSEHPSIAPLDNEHEATGAGLPVEEKLWRDLC